jgi:hypothetical protein
MATHIELVSTARPSAQLLPDDCVLAAVSIVLEEGGWCANAELVQRRLIKGLRHPKAWTCLSTVARYLNSHSVPAVFSYGRDIRELMQMRFAGGVVIGIDTSVLYGGPRGGHAIILDTGASYLYSFQPVKIIDPACQINARLPVQFDQLVQAYRAKSEQSLFIPSKPKN